MSRGVVVDSMHLRNADERISRLPPWLTDILQRVGWPLGEFVARATAQREQEHGRTSADACVLLRVDDYPHWSVQTSRFWEFHEVLAAAGINYLVAATPNLVSQPLVPGSPAREVSVEEWRRLSSAVAAGELEVALHGVTHGSMSARRPAEFGKMRLPDVQDKVRRGWSTLIERGCRPVAFVPPFNRFPTRLWSALPEDCRIVGLGPESLRDVQLCATPSRLFEKTVVISLPPFYGRARTILRALEHGRWLECRGVILPITLHWTWELDDSFRAVSELMGVLKDRGLRWAPLAAGGA